MSKKLLFAIVFTFLLSGVRAQLCQGSLGDPIVNITFGSGANPGAPLSAAATGYQYWSTDCPNDGQYTLRNRTDNCFSSSWYTLTSDHTGNTNGYFMLVNSSFQPSDFYVDTVDLFCSNTTYEFAAWVINMMRNTVCAGQSTILPNLTFKIEKPDGTLIQSYNTGDIPVSPAINWQQYGFYFTAPAGVDKIVLRITNNAPGGCGNDLALDDITFRPCGPLVSATITGNNGDFNLCEGESAQYTLSASISSGFDDPYYQWQASVNGGVWTDIPGANSATLVRNIDPSTAVGSYRYRLSVSKAENNAIALCRVNSGILTINVSPTPVTTVQSNAPLCAGNTLKLLASGGVVYQWSGPNAFTAQGPELNFIGAQPPQSGWYYVNVASDMGCPKKDSIEITVYPKPDAVVNPVDVSICEDEQVALSASGGNSYTWQPALGLSSSTIANPIASPSDSIRYQLIVANDFACTDTAHVQVNVLKKPLASAGPDREILQGQSITLLGTVGGSNIQYSWTPDHAISDVNILQPEVNPLADTSYILTVVSNSGCGNDMDTVKVKVFKGIFVPTAFTPNNDGLNDTWRIPGLGIYKDHEVIVFNRYGQVIFTTKNALPWDGRLKGQPQPTGAYPYLVKIKEGNILLKGLVMIIR